MGFEIRNGLMRVTSRSNQEPDLLIRALAPWIRAAPAPRAGVDFASLSQLAGRVPEGCTVHVDFRHAATLGAPLVILERPAAIRPPRWPATLTPREQEIAAFLATGASNKQIARAFGLTVGTVKAHVHTILGKLGLANRASVAASAWSPVGHSATLAARS
jgi:DNA-binding CsgD family transcriptional regulator